jgi:DNA-binding transcriptional LysR family regulator
VPARHEIARHERIAVCDLAEIPFVQVARPKAPAVHDAAMQIAALAGVQFDPVLETDSVPGTLNAVGSGLGFSLLPDYVRQIAPGTLVVAYHKDDRTPALEVFLGLLRAWIDEDAAC